jgi:hypothetical protein
MTLVADTMCFYAGAFLRESKVSVHCLSVFAWMLNLFGNNLVTKYYLLTDMGMWHSIVPHYIIVQIGEKPLNPFLPIIYKSLNLNCLIHHYHTLLYFLWQLFDRFFTAVSPRHIFSDCKIICYILKTLPNFA